jgi:hypothetical protein
MELQEREKMKKICPMSTTTHTTFFHLTRTLIKGKTGQRKNKLKHHKIRRNLTSKWEKKSWFDSDAKLCEGSE